MSIPILCLLAFVAWTLGLVGFGVGPARAYGVSKGLLDPKDVRADIPHGGPRYQRLMRAHGNCVENLPAFGCLVIVAELLRYRSTAMDVLCVVIVIARIGQSTAHIINGVGPAVSVRGALFIVQLICMFTIGINLAVHAGNADEASAESSESESSLSSLEQPDEARDC